MHPYYQMRPKARNWVVVLQCRFMILCLGSVWDAVLGAAQLHYKIIGPAFPWCCHTSHFVHSHSGCSCCLLPVAYNAKALSFESENV